MKQEDLLKSSIKSKLTITLAKTDDDFIDVILLKHADDSDWIGYNLSESQVFENMLDLKEKGYTFLIARQDTKAVGYSVGLAINNIYRTEGIYVIPESRNQGIGFAINKVQVKCAKAQGLEKVISRIHKTNTPSIQIHKKSGFNFNLRNDWYTATLYLQEN